ncbi:biotin--[acetyl-CoA-carboxylase] ligase [Acidicapsa acidisoli]|uniref:biotin--[acetyl-CoA-carboxylase] ligase n=1 Tax=Acidicapsa acidisoli TaxID=1615681 RepID=UPI0021DF5421|nr:biotin--[acetyl-CoA-carboxylase] ligase [Acidicapsa acidisoli]
MATSEPEELNAVEIDAALAGTPFHGRLRHFRSIDSTNTYALEQARTGAPHGSFYVADEQTAGRGRSDHSWHSSAGEGLYLSVLLRPALLSAGIAIADLTWLPLLAGLAAHRAIHEVTALDIDLRWPNDLLIDRRKTGGILVEAHAEAGCASSAVIGIGINLHQQRFPPGLATEPTSLDLETGRITSRQQLLIALLQSLHIELAALGSEAAMSAIPSRIAAISSWVQGRCVEVHGPQTCTGITDGLDERGFLRVRTANGLVTVTTGGIRDAQD